MCDYTEIAAVGLEHLEENVSSQLVFVVWNGMAFPELVDGLSSERVSARALPRARACGKRPSTHQEGIELIKGSEMNAAPGEEER